MGGRHLALLVAPVVLAGCADLVTPVAHSTHAAATAVRVTVAQRDLHGTVGLHGQIHYLRITAPDMDVTKELEPDGITLVRLPAGGDYDAQAWTRSCAQTCSTLRPARHRCETPFTVPTGDVTDLEARFPTGRGCVLSVSNQT